MCAAELDGVSGGHERLGAGGGPGAAPPQPLVAPGSLDDDFLHLAVPVTRQVQISGPREWKHLLCGVDSLDLGLHVSWIGKWDELSRALASGKQSAERTQGVLWSYPGAGDCLILPRGKPPMYGYHLQTPDFHLFLADREAPSDSFPNVYASILAKSLWLRGPRPAVEYVQSFVSRLGGRTDLCTPSRVDLCADFHIPGGLSLDFMRHHLVSRSKKTDQHLDGDSLETFYVGARGAPVLARVYDKAREIVAGGGEKLWFLDLWKSLQCVDVWRVEFQVRRQVLKQMRVHSFDALVECGGGLWQYLSEEWMSLRLADNENTARRTVHPFWLAVQDVGQAFGDQLRVKRNYAKGGQAPAEWYTSHASGCLAGYAARFGIDDFDSALGLMTDAMRTYWTDRDFEQRYKTERVKLGFDDEQDGEGDQ